MKTAEEFTDRKYKSFDELDCGNIWTNIEDLMIAFAQYHVEQALRACHTNSQLPEEDLEFTLDSYPLSNIK